MKTKIEIKSVFGHLLFEFEKENNSVKETLLKAIKSDADLSNADLSNANLSNADLSGADLSGADLSNANLSNADLSGADLIGANLSNADLIGADLSCANLSGANLIGADLSCAYYNESTSFLLSQCPSEGSFVGWKKTHGLIIKLLITETAKRSSATSLKCRCSEAKVLEIQNIDGSLSDVKEVYSNYDLSFIYRSGEIVNVDNFNEDRWNECSTGIHFFISREMAVKY
jgi:uncharacterized protein YjbI with pentapeptide repeats